MAEVIRLVEKLSATCQLAATLTPFTVSMMSSDDKCFVSGQTGYFAHKCPYAQCYGCDKFGHFDQDFPPKKFSIRNTMPPLQVSIEASLQPQPEGQIMLLLDPDIGDITTDHSPTPIHAMT